MIKNKNKTIQYTKKKKEKASLSLIWTIYTESLCLDYCAKLPSQR